MSDQGCGCGSEQNCPHRTSEANLWDGQFTTIQVPAGAGLNEVLALLENFVISSSQCNDVNYTLSAFSACLNLSAGTYSFSQILDAIVDRICSNASDISELQEFVTNYPTATTTTDNVLLQNLLYPPCFVDFVGTTSTDLFNEIMTKLCDLVGEKAPVTGDPALTLETPDAGAESDTNGTNVSAYLLNSRIEHVAEALKSILFNHSYIYEHTMPVTSPTSFVVELAPMRGVVDNFIVIRSFSEDMTVNPLKDTYFFLSGDSTILRREVANGAPAPAAPSTAHELYRVISDGSGVTTVNAIYEDDPLGPFKLDPGDVDTLELADGAVTSIKMADVVVGATEGDASIIEVTFNDKGQTTAVTSNLFLSGLVDGQTLVYDSANSRFINGDNVAISDAGFIPKSNTLGDNYENSSIYEAVTQMESSKKVEINVGAMEDDTSAMLNVVGGPLLLPRLTAVEGSALPLTDGYIIYATTTDATFTSVGVWAVENSVWIKL